MLHVSSVLNNLADAWEHLARHSAFLTQRIQAEAGDLWGKKGRGVD